MSSERYTAAALTDFATDLLDKAGMENDKSKVVAEILVEGDLLGHNTHGLQLLGPYLEDIEKGELAMSGQPRVIADLLPDLRAYGVSGVAPNGVLGDPTDATAEEGRAILEALVDHARRTIGR